MFRIRKIKKKIKRMIGSTRLYNRYKFAKIYEKNAFHKDGKGDSRSGPGSDMEQTASVRKALPILVEKFGIKKMLDVPCGDFYWMSHVDLSSLDSYTGGDIVPQMIQTNKVQHGRDNISFKEVDILNSKLDHYDLILVRDLFVHLKLSQIQKAIENIKASKSGYLLVTSFPDSGRNTDIGAVGEWRPLNMQTAPFNLGIPVYSIDENCTEENGKYRDKHLMLFKISEI